MAFLFLNCLALLSTFLYFPYTQPTPLLPPFNVSQHGLLKYLGLPNFGHILPALYVFGDSNIDAGNNNYLPTIARANYTPYGIDFGGGEPTGRYTNGRTAADFIAQLAGLPFPPPVLGMSAAEMNYTLTGVNFGSDSGGIQDIPPEAARIFGHVLSFQEQIQLFNMTARSIQNQFSSHESFAQYMSKSLFFINIGTNDLGVYWQLGQQQKPRKNATEYALDLSDKLSHGLKAIYELGARKFLVNNVSPLGCGPSNINTYKPNTTCVEDINQRVSYYNGLLPNMLANLEASLEGSTFVVCDLYRVFEDVYAQPAAYGFRNVSGFCCPDSAGNGTRECAKAGVPCMDRQTIVFFDPFHPTEASMHFIWARRLLKDSSVAYPINLIQLIQS
ncbi:GDSL-motif lipase 7 [Hibiscus trionum]|uniref:GDSL-motif lipase 7 n=1 Tax=Hibiscus trionum TaxID=183268 RepID=A0A9W7LXU8_HIBTR|nr:GDSL-motif lipase 7 [Hibiscus trionum]